MSYKSKQAEKGIFTFLYLENTTNLLFASLDLYLSIVNIERDGFIFFNKNIKIILFIIKIKNFTK